MVGDIEGTVEGHRDGHGFVRPDSGDATIYLAPQEMRSVLHRDRVRVRVLRLDRKGRPEGRVLLVDDLADTGITLRAVVDRLRGMPAIQELRAAVIWVKGVSSYVPDYYVETLPTSPWIHQPFEEYDNLRPDGLARKFAV